MIWIVAEILFPGGFESFPFFGFVGFAGFLGLYAIVSRKRDLDLIEALVDKVRTIALCRPLLLAADGLVSYVTAFRTAFRSKVYTGEGNWVAASWFAGQTSPLCKW